MPLILVCAAALIGLALGDVSRLTPAPLLFAALLGALGAVAAWRRPRWRLAALVACALAVGALRASPPLPLPRPSGEQVASPGATAPTDRLPAIASAAVDLRQRADAGIHAYLPEPQASLAAGVLLGGSGHLEQATRLELRRSGLAHIVAIDGFKLAVVAATITMLLSGLIGIRAALVTSMTAIAGYTLLTGAHPSAVRAALMVGLASCAALSGRIADPLTSLLVAATAMAVLEPRILLDVGLQLSLSATLGIMLLWPRVRRWLHRWPRLVAEPVGLTLAVTLGTLPVTLSVFQQVSLVSPLAHIAAIPLLAPVLVSAALLAAVAPLGSLQTLTQSTGAHLEPNQIEAASALVIAALTMVPTVVAWLAWVPSTLLAGIVHLFGGLPGAAVSTGRLPPSAALGLASALLGWGVWGMPELRSLRLDWRTWRGAHPRLLAPAACITTCAAAALLLSALRPDGQLHVEQLDVGHGQAVFIRGPTGHTALIVSGRPDALRLAQQVAEHLAVWEHTLDLAASDPGARRALGMTLGRYPAQQVSELGSASRLDVGGGAVLDVSAVNGRLDVVVVPPTSTPTTSAARPGSAN